MIIVLLSFILDGIISLLIDQDSFMIPLFSIISLVLIYPYNKNKKNLLLFGIIVGVLYDIVYTQTLFLNTFIIFLISLIILLFYKYVPYNILNSCIISLFLIILFRFITYLIIILANNVSFNFYTLVQSIITSLLGNILYLILMFFFLKKFYSNLTKNKI